jgi:hypothetical protein
MLESMSDTSVSVRVVDLTTLLQDEWKESQFEYIFKITEGRRYLKVILNKSVYMFVDKNTGDVYMPASYKAPAKGVRFHIDNLLSNPEICDPYGSFLYRR